VFSITYSLFNSIRVSTAIETQRSRTHSVQERIYKQLVFINNNIYTFARAFLAR